MRGVRARDVGWGLKDGLLELRSVLFAPVRRDMVEDGPAAGGLAYDRDAGCVSAEEMDVVLYPLECLALVLEPDIGHSSGRGE